MSEQAECVHDWQRARDRDRIQGPMLDGRIGNVWLVFWCPKCAATTTERVDFDEAARSTLLWVSPEEAA